MSEFLGSRISLVSKSDIRYVGKLHEINSDESTVSLENVRSFGTEGRMGRPEDEIAPADQVYDYIVFRGSDVKDLRIEEHPGIKENKPPVMPNDPAIVGARVQAPNQHGPPGGPPSSFGPVPYPPNNFYGGPPPPPPPGSWGRGGGPGMMPGPGFGNMPYPPPPGWFPPGQGPSPGMQGGPGQWHNQQYHPGPPGASGNELSPNQRQFAPAPTTSDIKSAPVEIAQGRSKPTTPSGQPAPPTEPKSLAQVARQASNAPNPPVASKPSVAEVRAVAATLNSNGAAPQVAAQRVAPTGPKNVVMPVIPLPGPGQRHPAPVIAEQNAAGQTTVRATAAGGPTSVQDATNAARAAVAVAMSQLGNSGGNAMDNLAKKVNEMRVQAVRGGNQSRGRGRGGGRPTAKVEVPDSDFDFAQSNAKFNKEDVGKEAHGTSVPDEVETLGSDDTESAAAEDNTAYNKTTSFFDNISSEAKDRAGTGGQRPGGREWRGEEQRKNMETFGQGSVDGGHRNYRGRGRGRGYRGRGGYSRGGQGEGRPQYQSTPAAQ